MFTGIIETVGQVISATHVGGDVRIVIDAPDFRDKNIGLGDSVACNGVCLTVVEMNQTQLTFDVSVESLDHSLIGQWQAGTKINLELALLPTTRLGGHLVSGHVDGIAKLVGLKQDARSWRLDFELPSKLSKYVANKGSITINGTSLTVNTTQGSIFSVNVIPHTFEVTTLGGLKQGDSVHIEVDLIARYLEKLLSGDDRTSSSIDESFLSKHGFA